MFKIEFKTGNAAFTEYGEYEVNRILKSIIEKLEYGHTDGEIMDINGNNIGHWEWDKD